MLQFWCSARSVPWDWTWRAIWGVWLFIGLVAWSVWRWNRAAARRTDTPPEPAHPLYVLGLVVLWLSLDWPIGALGAGYLASVHMLQFLLMALVAPPLLLRGVTPAMLQLLEGDSRAARFVRGLTQPLVALVLFNVAVLITHVPGVVDTLMVSQAGSLLIDLMWIVAGIVFWWPVMLDVPRHPRFVPPLRMGYLVVGLMFSPIMFGLVGFMVYSATPLYGVFELAPRIPGLSAQEDLQLAGVMMSIGGAFIAFVGLTIIFFRWSRNSA